RGAAPGPVRGSHLILVDMYLARGVLGDHRGVVGADRTSGMEVLDHGVVTSCRRLIRISADVDENCVRLGHPVLPFGPPRMYRRPWTADLQTSQIPDDPDHPGRMRRV